jgi:predicted metalloendopeptidase
MKKAFVHVLLVAVAITATAFGHLNRFQALNLNYIDSSVDPGNDFYTYVNGKWMETAEIPSDRGRWGSFDALDKKADSMALQVLDEAIELGVSRGVLGKTLSDQEKAVVMYQTVMDLENRNKQGIAPIVPYIKEVQNIKKKKDLFELMVKNAPFGESILLGFYVSSDVKNSNANALYAYGPSLGLPDRDYYLGNDEKSKALQLAYFSFMKETFQAFEITMSDKELKQIYEFEKKLAASQMDRVERRDPNKQYNPRSKNEFVKEMKGMPVQEMLNALGIGSADQIIIGELKFMNVLASEVKKAKVVTLKNVMLWNVLRGSMRVLSEDLERKSFEFYGKTLRGTPEQSPLKERALGVVNGSLGEALGKLYVEKYFPKEAKAKAQAMVDDVIAAYRVRINNLDWMSPETKQKAQKKLDKLTVKIGYPDKWKDYASLNVVSYANGGSYFQNMLNLSKWSMADNMSKLGKPVDKTEWGMSPQTVNAYYNPVYNEIVFPAAILQPPFFDFNNDPAVNFGGIGAVIGHEISHGFDDAGAQFDENGNLVNWWTATDLVQFKERGKKLAEQYDKYEALPGKFVNGAFTLGENIGDLGGVASAYDGLLIHLKREGSVGEIDGYTQEQRFFMSWATVWRNKIRDEELAMRLLTDPHSPGYFRAIGPLENHEGFYKAFDVKEGHKMYKSKADRVEIW